MTHARRLACGAPAVALAVVWAVATTIGPFSDTTVNDLFVYRTYADLLAGGQLPYLDFGFEYPPLAALPAVARAGCRAATRRRTP